MAPHIYILHGHKTVNAIGHLIRVGRLTQKNGSPGELSCPFTLSGHGNNRGQVNRAYRLYLDTVYNGMEPAAAAQQVAKAAGTKVNVSSGWLSPTREEFIDKLGQLFNYLTGDQMLTLQCFCLIPKENPLYEYTENSHRCTAEVLVHWAKCKYVE